MAKLIVVEDDPDIMRILLHMLKNGGHTVIPGYGAEDALRKLRQHKPDMLLTDLAMPKMNGVELIQKVKDDPELCYIICVAVTAHLWDTLAQSAATAGCDGYLSKPFSAKQLLEFVEKHLAPGH